MEEQQNGQQSQQQESDPQGSQSRSTEQMVKELMDGFKQQWEPVMENLEIAEQAGRSAG